MILTWSQIQVYDPNLITNTSVWSLPDHKYKCMNLIRIRQHINHDRIVPVHITEIYRFYYSFDKYISFYFIAIHGEWITFERKQTFALQRNWVFATNSDFLIPISLRPDVVDLRYFKVRTLFDQITVVWNIKGLHHRVAKI